LRNQSTAAVALRQSIEQDGGAALGG